MQVIIALRQKYKKQIPRFFTIFGKGYFHICETKTFEGKHFSKITSFQTSVFKSFSNINNSRRYSHFKINLGTFCLYNTAN